MTPLKKLAVAVLASAAVTVAVPALAQVYTTETVATADPFGGLGIDTKITAMSEFSALLARLGPNQQADLTGRCIVIARNQAAYGEEASVFCQNLLFTTGGYYDVMGYTASWDYWDYSPFGTLEPDPFAPPVS